MVGPWTLTKRTDHRWPEKVLQVTICGHETNEVLIGSRSFVYKLDATETDWIILSWYANSYVVKLDRLVILFEVIHKSWDLRLTWWWLKNINTVLCVDTAWIYRRFGGTTACNLQGNVKGSFVWPKSIIRYCQFTVRQLSAVDLQYFYVKPTQTVEIEVCALQRR